MEGSDSSVLRCPEPACSCIVTYAAMTVAAWALAKKFLDVDLWSTLFSPPSSGPWAFLPWTAPLLGSALLMFALEDRIDAIREIK